MSEVTTVEARHPKGLYLLFATEMWERFNFYGMRALLVLFLAGIIAQILYERTKKNSVICMGLLSLFYSVLLWSITVNILNYNTIILCWLISFATLFFIKKSNFAAPQKTAD